MTGCSAVHCNNSSQKGYIMKVFPRDPKRRAQWAANIKRENWSPTNASYLCEVHFEPHMWEKRMDGAPKLKPNAVPTIFGFYLKKKSSGENGSNIDNLNVKKFDNLESHNLKSKSIVECEETPITGSNTNINLCTIEGNSIKFEIQPITEALNTSSTSNSSERPMQGNLQYILNKQAVEIWMLRKRLKRLRNINKKIMKENDKNIYKRKLEKVFTDDQIKALATNSNRRRHWSDETIIKALKLKFSCGECGYEELRKQNIPLPSIRTLQTRLQELKLSSRVSDKIFEFLHIFKMKEIKSARLFSIK